MGNRIRDKIIKVWLSDIEYKNLQDKAAYCGTSMSAYIREMIENGAIIHYEPIAIREVCYELNRIGNNINQIAKKVNERNVTLTGDIKDLKQQYEQLFNIVLEKIMGVG